jgi:hypothetical protein
MATELFGKRITRLMKEFSRLTPKKRVSTQLFLLDSSQPTPMILLGTHSELGIFPHRITGLCATVFSTPEEALVQAAADVNLELQTPALSRRAILQFLESDDPETMTEEWICFADLPGASRRILNATDLWTPTWVSIEQIPYGRMPVDDAIWYPPILEGKCLGGRFAFQGRTLVSSALWEFSAEEQTLMDQYFSE